MSIKNKIKELTPQMIKDLEALVQYNSELAPALLGMPFGEAPAKVLDEMLRIAQRMGFRTKNLDNYCGYAEVGEGSDIIGIVSHLDIVPAGEGWNTDPFTLTRIGDTLFGRGVSDDKGAAVASLYAVKLLVDSGIQLNKRIRLIFGCNEETGSLCMKHYNEVEEPVTIGFTPDGEFPGIHGEKGMIKMSALSKSTKIVSMNGGFVSNAVCNRCTTVIPAADVSEEKLREALADTGLESFELTKEGSELKIEAIGVAAHASTPLLGVNAAGCTMQALSSAGMQDDFVDYYNSHIGNACNGEGYALNVSDDYGELTLSNGIVSTKDGVISCTIDIRYPVTFTEAELRERMTPFLEDEKGVTVIDHFSDPLFYPADSALVKALYDAYVEVTGDTRYQPMVIGGGTYAKSIPGIIAFGCQWMDTDNHIHDANEKLEIPEFEKQVEIYVRAVEKLLAL